MPFSIHNRVRDTLPVREGRYLEYAAALLTGIFISIAVQITLPAVKDHKMKFQLYFWILVAIFGMQPGLEAGKIYHWVDKDGVQHFTNLPPPPGAQIVEGLSETPPDKSPADRKDKRITKGGKEGPAAPVDTGAIEDDQNDSADGGDPGAVQSGDRRFRKWNDEPNDREDTDASGFGTIRPYDDRQEPGTIEGGENTPANGEDPGAEMKEENSPSDRRLN